MSKKIDMDIAIPSSYTLNLSSLTQRTFVLSFLARSAGIFGVRNIYVYHDPINYLPEVEKQIIKILRYLSIPPYLKKLLFKIDRDLAYVGMAPPLTLVSHKKWIAIKDLKYPEYRIGYLIGKRSGRYLIDVGLDKPVAIKEKPKRKVVVVEINKSTSKYLIGRLLNEDEYKELDFYPGYNVKRLKTSIITFLKKYKGCKVCLSKYGEYIGKKLKHLRYSIAKHDKILLILGSYGYGLYEIFQYYNIEPEKVCDYIINLVYDQKVETIRVEEAALIGLAIFDLIRSTEISNK